MPFASVLVCRNVPSLYTYEIPDDESEVFRCGTHVEIPFGRGSAQGLIMAITDTCKYDTVKPITACSAKKPVVSEDLCDLIRWFYTYYHTTPHKAYQTVIGRLSLRDPDIDDSFSSTEPPHSPTDEQAAAISDVLAFDNTTFLLHGVTSSGKTEVYMHLAQTIIDKGQGVLMLLPEIALTPQMRRHFTQRFGSKVSVVHSGLTPKQRSVQWANIASGEVPIVIGPRSAIFAPMPHIGLIILDEEHESSYKQDNHPRYHTHSVASYRREKHHARLIYGSATPRLELLATDVPQSSSDTGPTHRIISLLRRVNNKPLPPVHIEDMRYDERTSILSATLRKHITQTLKRGEKIMLLLNRRGYASYVSCQHCGTIHTCPHCQLSFTYHKSREFRCHRCDITAPLTHDCSACGRPRLAFTGMGTQKLETELQTLFPSASVVRMDRDTVASATRMSEALDTFREDGDIMIGTQMIAKGHHFKEVTLVGVLGIDTVLSLPDFRSSERAFQLLCQVAGRAGRGDKPGQVIVQTYQPEHYVMDFIRDNNPGGFYDKELGFRQQLSYPPYSRLINVIFSAKHPGPLEAYAASLTSFLKTELPEHLGVDWIGPKPAPIEKVRDYFRWHVLLKCPHAHFDTVKDTFLTRPTAHQSVRFVLDFDPISIL